MGLGGDGFYARIDRRHGTSLRFFQGNNSGAELCTSNCTAPGASWTMSPADGEATEVLHHAVTSPWRIPGGDDCPAAGVPGRYATNRGLDETRETVSGGNSSSPARAGADEQLDPEHDQADARQPSSSTRSFRSRALIAGTNDATPDRVQPGTGAVGQANWVERHGRQRGLPTARSRHRARSGRPRQRPVGYAAVGGF
jgi:hypothetical protein